MRTYAYRNRREYLDAQIVRSQKKFGYCKVYFSDALRYKHLIALDRRSRAAAPSPSAREHVLCLGVRSGAENDIFRAAFAPAMRLRFIQDYALRKDVNHLAENKMRIARRISRWSLGYSPAQVMGVEVNPDAERRDIHVGSFDELPAEWENRFSILFSNSFDHAEDPARVIAEWKRVSQPGAYLILAFTPEKTPTESDPLGGLSLETLRSLVAEPLVYYSETANITGYYEACFRIEK